MDVKVAYLDYPVEPVPLRAHRHDVFLGQLHRHWYPKILYFDREAVDSDRQKQHSQ